MSPEIAAGQGFAMADRTAPWARGPFQLQIGARSATRASVRVHSGTPPEGGLTGRLFSSERRGFHLFPVSAPTEETAATAIKAYDETAQSLRAPSMSGVFPLRLHRSDSTARGASTLDGSCPDAQPWGIRRTLCSVVLAPGNPEGGSGVLRLATSTECAIFPRHK